MSTLHEIFDAASDLEPDEWPAFLENATPDPALRRRALELLESSRRAGDFLRSPTLDASGNAIPDEPGSRFAPGSAIGPYEILLRLGSGGSGIVFLARQRQPISREVALKLLRTAIEDEEPRWRFEVEKQAISRMDHPGIARVLDAGLTDENRPWIAMEYVPGESITAWCDAHGLSLEDRASLLAEVCDAVHHAHQKGVIHRDLKPSNILVAARPDALPRPCIIDFGIARITGVSSPLHTRPGQLPGTPAYMSPEQLAGDSAALDARTDIYSLGVILRELLPASLRGDLSAITLRCLETDPSRRYPSADALAADLRAFVARRPVTARHPTPGYLFLRFIRRRPFATTTAAAALLGILAATLLILRSEQRAILEKKTAETERARAEDLFHGFSHLIFAGNPELGNPKDYPLHQAVIDFANRLPAELRRDPLTEAHARHTLGHALHGMGETETALAQYEAALALADRIPSSRSEEFHPWLLFNTAIAVRDPARARDLLIRAETQFAALPEKKHHLMRIRTLCQIAVLDADQKRYHEAAEIARRAISLAEELDPADPALLAKALWTLARIEHNLGRFDEARRLHQRRLTLLRQTYGPEHPEVWNTLTNLAGYDIPGPAQDAALATLAETAEKTARHFGPAHLQTHHVAIARARGLAAAGLTRESAALYRSTLAQARAHLPPGTPIPPQWQAELAGFEEESP